MVRVATISIISALLLTCTEAASKICVVSKSNIDDGITITKAFNDCKNGGTVSFPRGNIYYLKSMLELTGLKNVNVDFAGKIVLPRYDKKFSEGSAYLHFSGDNINFYGGGTINGNGQSWYDAEDNTAPIVIRISARNSVFRKFRIVNAPNGHIAVNGADNVVLERIHLDTKSKSSKPAKNTDAFGASSSSNIIFRNMVLNVGDDCAAINGGTSNITITNIDCTNGHGFSVGSLGKDGKTEYVNGVTITDSTCTNCQNGVRIKTWPGGKGSVQNIKFQNVKLINTENPVIMTTHYCDNNHATYCKDNAATSLSISNVIIDRISGSTSSKKLPAINIDCATNAPCKNFSLTNINLKRSSNTPKNVCNNLIGSSKIPYCKQ